MHGLLNQLNTSPGQKLFVAGFFYSSHKEMKNERELPYSCLCRTRKLQDLSSYSGFADSRIVFSSSITVTLNNLIPVMTKNKKFWVMNTRELE